MDKTFDINTIEDLQEELLDLAAITRYPSPINPHPTHKTDEDKISYIANRFRDIMIALDLDLTDQSLAKTPERVARMYVNEIFSGLKRDEFPSISYVEDTFLTEGASNIVFSKATFTSFCEHHFVPFHGMAYVAYKPKGKLIGLSKIHRIVRYFAKRPQVQERLTAQIADALSILLETEDIAVALHAHHFCVIARGVEDDASFTVTHGLRGAFETNLLLRQEFFNLITPTS